MIKILLIKYHHQLIQFSILYREHYVSIIIIQGKRMFSYGQPFI